jgi:hypothetical protein
MVMVQVEVKLANQAAQAVKSHALTILEMKEEADSRLETARRAHEKARKKAEDNVRKMEEEIEKVGNVWVPGGGGR